MAEDKRSFWVTIPGILTGIAGVITAITGLVVVIKQINPDGPESSTIEIVAISSHSPDHVVLENTTDAMQDISGFLLKEGGNECSIPLGTELAPSESFTAYFFSPRNAGDAVAHERQNHFVCTKAFGISSGETIEVLTPGRKPVTKKTAS